MNYYNKTFIILFLIFFIISITKAQSIEELRKNIGDRNYAINKLEQEIAKYQIEIDDIGKKKDSLNNTIKSLDISKKKLETNTEIIKNKIYSKNLEIKELLLQIDNTGGSIIDGKNLISKSLYNIYQNNPKSIIESILNKKSFSDMWKNEEEFNTLQGSMQNKIKNLRNLKINLEENRKSTEKKKLELIALTDDLKNQTKIIIETVKEKNTILSETKNTEANYNKLLADRKTQKVTYEKEVLEFESALRIAIDPKSIPAVASGVLKWPLDNIRITQYFGNTEFSSKNPQAYSGLGHNGIDLATPIGTPVKSALGGIIIGSGNMDLANRGRCRSYGKWIMVKHFNGLSTLYGHLSFIKVNNNQQVSTGDIIGYSGNTGYSTGPHLHFSVYATEGVRITKMLKSINCRDAVIPLADLKAYLNPLSYLP